MTPRDLPTLWSRLARWFSGETKAVPGNCVENAPPSASTAKIRDDVDPFSGSATPVVSTDHSEHADSTQAPEQIQGLAQRCFSAADIHEAVDTLISSARLNDQETLLFHLEMATLFSIDSDRMTALHFIRTAMESPVALTRRASPLIVKKALALGHTDLAAEVFIRDLLESSEETYISDKEKQIIKKSYNNMILEKQKKIEHGHDLLLDYLKSHLAEYRDKSGTRKPLLIEIGTTRENVPGQGSTRKIAEFCKNNQLDFITVDMDPHNSHMAAAMFSTMQVPFQAITAKGEDFLKDFPDQFDFIFLDAYDFDHGKHSALRQSRYRKFLGEPIDEQACHRMHQECAESVLEKLSEWGIVCIDDTWLDDGQWTAKGTLAMPYLLEHGFTLLEARNRAALLARQHG